LVYRKQGAALTPVGFAGLSESRALGIVSAPRAGLFHLSVARKETKQCVSQIVRHPIAPVPETCGAFVCWWSWWQSLSPLPPSSRLLCYWLRGPAATTSRATQHTLRTMAVAPVRLDRMVDQEGSVGAKAAVTASKGLMGRFSARISRACKLPDDAKATTKRKDKAE